jgi:peptidoglycan/LPS O-acetylase OafA/YrhL
MAVERRTTLDGIRFFAFLAVYLFHALHKTDRYGWIPFVKFGHHGVQVFFVLSGFLIGRLLLDMRARTDLGLGSRLKTFYCRRALRIFPIYYLTAAALAAVLLAQGAPFLDRFIADVFYVQNMTEWIGIQPFLLDYHFWTLCVEEQFYLVAPLMVLLLPRRVLASVIVSACIGVPVARGVLAANHLWSPIVWNLAPLHADALLLGIAVAWIEREGSFLGVTPAVLLRAGTVAGVCFSLVLANSYHVFIPHADVVGPALEQATCSLAAGAGVLAAWTASPASFAYKILANRRIVFLGQTSYASYLFHQLVINPMGGGSFSLPLAIAGFLVTVSLSAHSWTLIENPLIQFASRRWPYAVDTATASRKRADHSIAIGAGASPVAHPGPDHA